MVLRTLGWRAYGRGEVWLLLEFQGLSALYLIQGKGFRIPRRFSGMDGGFRFDVSYWL